MNNHLIIREAEQLLAQYLKQQKVIIVIGARQVGKTTLIKKALTGLRVELFNLDIETDRQRVKSSGALTPQQAMQSFGDPQVLVIDEAQRLPEIGRIVKGWYDSGVSAKIILSGSSSLDLLDFLAESLTGRNVKLNLPPLLFREIIADQPWYVQNHTNEQFKEFFGNQVQGLLMQHLIYGSYPEVTTTSNRRDLLTEISGDYLLKDILQMGLVKTPDLIRRLLMLLAYQIGSEVSINEISSKLQISRVTVERYLNLLERTFVIFRLPAFSTNSRKEITKNHKLYFWDTGIRNAILNEFSENPLRSDIGPLWENWAVAELAKQNLLSGGRASLYFWRSRSGSEVDVVVRKDEALSAYEIKWNPRSIRAQAFENSYKTKVALIDHTNPLITL